jgi:hypothetical protein
MSTADRQVGALDETQLAQALDKGEAIGLLRGVEGAKPAEAIDARGGLAAGPSGQRQRGGEGDESAAREGSHGTSLAMMGAR